MAKIYNQFGEAVEIPDDMKDCGNNFDCADCPYLVLEGGDDFVETCGITGEPI